MNSTITDATVKRFHADGHGRLRAPRADFMSVYTSARRLKTRVDPCSRPHGTQGPPLTPCERICQIWTAEPDKYILSPTRQVKGLSAKGCVDAHRHRMMLAAMATKAEPLSVLRHRVAIPLSSSGFPKKYPIR